MTNSNMTIEQIKVSISEVEDLITHKQQEIEAKQSEIDNFEYKCTEQDYDDFLDDIDGSVNVCGMTFYPSDILKSCDPIAYRCGKSEYESNFDLEDCEEYVDLKNDLEQLGQDLEDLENELNDLQDDLDNLQNEE